MGRNCSVQSTFCAWIESRKNCFPLISRTHSYSSPQAKRKKGKNVIIFIAQPKYCRWIDYHNRTQMKSIFDSVHKENKDSESFRVWMELWHCWLRVDFISVVSTARICSVQKHEQQKTSNWFYFIPFSSHDLRYNFSF